MNKYHLAEINIGYARYSTDAPDMKDFLSRLNEINLLAEQSPGFVWRLQTDEGNAIDIHVFDDDKVLINLSVWKSIVDLKKYIYEGAHLEMLKLKDQWFEKIDTAYYALWWIPEGHQPDIVEALSRLSYLNEYGPTPEAFTFNKTFEPESEN